MDGRERPDEGQRTPPSGAAAALMAAPLGAVIGLLAAAIAQSAPLALYLVFISMAYPDSAEAIGGILLIAVLTVLAAASVWGCARGLRALSRPRPGADRPTVAAAVAFAIVVAFAVPVNPLEEHLHTAASVIAVALATASTAAVTVRSGLRVRGARVPSWAAAALIGLPIVGVIAGAPLLTEISARGEVQDDIDAYGGDLAVVDGGGWRVSRVSWNAEDEYLDVAYEKGGDSATLRHIPADEWGDEGTADGNAMCPLRGFTCEEADGGSLLLVKEDGRLYSAELTLDHGSGVSVNVDPDYSKPEDEQISPQVVGDLAEHTRPATPEDRDRLVDAAHEQRH